MRAPYLPTCPLLGADLAVRTVVTRLLTPSTGGALPPGLPELIMPLFVRSGVGAREEIRSLPGLSRLSPDLALEKAHELNELGITRLLLFGMARTRDPLATEAFSDENPVLTTLRLIKRALPETVLIADLCLCHYTSHGHCGVIRNGEVDNDATIEALLPLAVAQARAGADMVMPSGMMDGGVAAVRRSLNAAGLPETAIFGQSVKFASDLYGPFREAIDVHLGHPDGVSKSQYQVDPARPLDGVHEALEDRLEGADLVMIKPALPYLDVIRRVSEKTDCPVAAFQTSGEYGMIHSHAVSSQHRRELAVQALRCMRRAGAACAVSYFSELILRGVELP